MTQVEKIVSEVLEYDLLPPDEDYDPREHGREIAAKFSKELNAQIIKASLEKLPGTTAYSFLSGLLPECNVQNIDDLLYALIKSSNSIDSAGTIVELMTERGIQSEWIVCQLIDDLQSTHNEASQNRMAFAIWTHLKGGPSIRLVATRIRRTFPNSARELAT